MRTKKFVFLSCFITATALSADVECALDEKNLKSKYPEKAKSIVGTAKKVKGLRSLEEQIKLVSGISFSYKQEGCNHFSQTYRFDNVPDTTEVSDRKHYFILAAKLLKTRLGEKSIEAKLAQRCERLAPKVVDLVRKGSEDNSQVWVDHDSCSKAKCST